MTKALQPFKGAARFSLAAIFAHQGTDKSCAPTATIYARQALGSGLGFGLALTCLLGLPAAAEGGARMSPDEFEAYVTGRTLVYNSAGQPYGIEEYLPGRRVRWAFSGDECVEGYWYVEAELICFSYENNLDPQCWSFEQGQSGLIARFEDSDEIAQLYETRQSSQEMSCFGPKVGS